MIPFCLKALMAHDVPQHQYRLWGAAANDLPSDPHFRVKTMGWWGMTETITHGIVSSLHLPSPPLATTDLFGVATFTLVSNGDVLGGRER